MYCQLFSWLLPTGAIRPESGSIQAILTTCPSSGFALLAWPIAAVAVTTMAAPTVTSNRRRLSGVLVNFIG